MSSQGWFQNCQLREKAASALAAFAVTRTFKIGNLANVTKDESGAVSRDVAAAIVAWKQVRIIVDASHGPSQQPSPTPPVPAAPTP